MITVPSLENIPLFTNDLTISARRRSWSNLLPNSVVMNGDHIVFYAALFSMIAVSLAYRVESVPMLTEDLKFKPVLHHLETLLA